MHGKWGAFARWYLGLGEWAAAKFPHYCITVSHVLQVYIRDTLHRSAIYIPNGAEVKTDPGDDRLADFGLVTGQYVLNVGRVVPQKGIHYLVQAWKKLSTDKKLVIVGAPSFTDDYIKELKRQAADDPRIIFLGFQKGRVLDQLYANAYLYVHPSEAEGLPLVILEAMSFGIAPLVSDIPPNVEAIHGAGWTFRSTDVDDLRERLHFLLTHHDEVRVRGEQARIIVRDRFNWEAITSRIESVYISSRH
jgi:glycosyltransferase involved in cell wall biosynthesis